jgi:hypothetical protein
MFSAESERIDLARQVSNNLLAGKEDFTKRILYAFQEICSEFRYQDKWIATITDSPYSCVNLQITNRVIALLENNGMQNSVFSILIPQSYASAEISIKDGYYEGYKICAEVDRDRVDIVVKFDIYQLSTNLEGFINGAVELKYVYEMRNIISKYLFDDPIVDRLLDRLDAIKTKANAAIVNEICDILDN